MAQPTAHPDVNILLERIQSIVQDDSNTSSSQKGFSILHCLHEFGILRKSVADIVRPFLNCPSELDCLLTGSSVDKRDQKCRWYKSFKREDLKLFEHDFDMMLVLNKLSPLYTNDFRETAHPAFYTLQRPHRDVNQFLSSLDCDVIDSHTFMHLIRTQLYHNLNSDYVYVKSASACVGSPAVTF